MGGTTLALQSLIAKRSNPVSAPGRLVGALLGPLAAEIWCVKVGVGPDRVLGVPVDLANRQGRAFGSRGSRPARQAKPQRSNTLLEDVRGHKGIRPPSKSTDGIWCPETTFFSDVPLESWYYSLVDLPS